MHETGCAEEDSVKNGDSRVALVSGAAHGIGEGIAARLAANGYAVALLDINTARCGAVAERLAYEHGVETLSLIADTGTEPEVREAMAAVRERFGRLDALVNNAGNPNPSTAPIDELDRATWDRYLEVNLTGYFLLAKHAMPMLRESSGAIVNIASIHALQSDAHHNMAYAATKGGVLAFTHALALAEGPAVRVNAISPGWIDVRNEEKRKASPLRDIDHAQHPAGRVGEPRDIAALAAFLLSDDARFITGENVIADGGMTRKMAFVD